MPLKLPRWLVIAMLTSSVLAVLAAAGWWWVKWPERTARGFVDRLAAGKDAQASRMFESNRGSRKLGFVIYEPINWSDVEARPLDAVCGSSPAC